MPILIRTDHGLIIGGDAGSLFNISINNSSIWSVGANGTANQQAIIAYRRCMRPGNPNLTNSSIAGIVAGCCIGLPQPVVGVNSAVNGSAGAGNASLVTTARIGGPSYPPGGRCCYPIVVASPDGSSKIGIRRCMHGPMPLGANFTINGSWGGIWNSTQINISVNRTTGNFNEQCAYQNGALSCNPGNGVRPQDIIAGIGTSIAAWGSPGFGGNSSIGSNSTVNVGTGRGIGAGGNAGVQGGGSVNAPSPIGNNIGIDANSVVNVSAAVGAGRI